MTTITAGIIKRCVEFQNRIAGTLLITTTHGATRNPMVHGKTVKFRCAPPSPPLLPPSPVLLPPPAQPNKKEQTASLKPKGWVTEAPLVKPPQVQNLLRFLLKKCLTGATCMKWTDQEKYVEASHVENFGTGDHNYCRYHQKMC